MCEIYVLVRFTLPSSGKMVQNRDGFSLFPMVYLLPGSVSKGSISSSILYLSLSIVVWNHDRANKNEANAQLSGPTAQQYSTWCTPLFFPWTFTLAPGFAGSEGFWSLSKRILKVYFKRPQSIPSSIPIPPVSPCLHWGGHIEGVGATSCIVLLHIHILCQLPILQL